MVLGEMQVWSAVHYLLYDLNDKVDFDFNRWFLKVFFLQFNASGKSFNDGLCIS